MAAPADEAWKVIICARDIQRAEDALATVEYIASGGFGRNTTEERLASIRTMSGAEIADTIRDHIEDRRKSVETAIAKD